MKFNTFHKSLFILILYPSLLLAKEEPITDIETLPLDELRTFSEIFAKIKSDYVETVDDKTLLENAVRGMLEGLDPHSSYLDGDAYKELQEGTSGEFGGLGIEVGQEDGFIKVISPIDDTPAQRAGIQAGDLIIKLDDKPVKGMGLDESVKMMRGKVGTDLTLTILRETEEKPLTITITRDKITVKSVRSEMLEPGFGYLRISNFQNHTTDDTKKNLTKLIKNADNNLQGLIIDLRNNPGGLLTAAVGISDLFLESGLIVYTEGRVKDSALKFNAKPDDELKGAPIMVLVNGGSASASEIVAGALQDHNRAVIIGEPTFGKGSVQTVLPMNNEAALKLTTARYFTPSGRSIQASGIEPDIILDAVQVSKVENAGRNQIKEADLSGHLENDQNTNKNNKNSSSKKEDEVPLAERDYQLYETLNVLKALAIQNKKKLAG